MPRRASSGISPQQIVGLVVAIILVAGIGFLILKTFSHRSQAASSQRATNLNVSDYLENANSLRGNVYAVTGIVEDQLKWTPNNGRLFSIEAEDNFGEITPLPIHVPQDFSKMNIDRGSRFRFVVEVGRDGTLVAENIEKN
ncbi:MAG: hypothetical protein AAGD22_02300 [Verrucomicrobiota bacterium]